VSLMSFVCAFTQRFGAVVRSNYEDLPTNAYCNQLSTRFRNGRRHSIRQDMSQSNPEIDHSSTRTTSTMDRDRPAPCTRKDLCDDFVRLGIEEGDVVMIHSSYRAIRPVVGGPATVLDALLDAVGPGGTILAYVSWDRSCYTETQGEAGLTVEERERWPAFVPEAANAFPGFGVLNSFLLKLPHVKRSAHPDASVAAVGHKADWITSDHSLYYGYGPGSPFEKLVRLRGKVVLLGAPLDTVTLLHHAEAIADLPGKRIVKYELPVLDSAGNKRWAEAEEFDTNGIIECYAKEGQMDSVETVSRAFLQTGRYSSGRVGHAKSLLFDARELVDFGKTWLEDHHG